MEYRVLPILILINLGLALSGCSVAGSLNDGNGLSQSPGLTCDASITDGFGGGDGTSDDPYQICSVEQWNYIQEDSANFDKSFILQADLDFTGVTATDFEPIGDSSDPFTGHLDGNNKKIQNLNVTESGGVALFLNTDYPAKIENLVLEDITLTSTTGGSSGLVLKHGTGGVLELSNITASDIEVVTSTGQSGIGGLVGYAEGPITAEDITLTGITLNVANSSNGIGGLVGAVTGASQFSNIQADTIFMNYSTRSITTAGGLVGLVTSSSASFTNVSVHDLDLRVSNYAGGILAQTSKADVTIQNAQVTGSMHGSTSAGLIGRVDAMFAPNLTVMISDSSFEGTLPYGGNGMNGGLIGTTAGLSTTIESSYSILDLDIWTGFGAGLVGYSGATTLTITDSYARGSIASDSTNGSGVIGGLVGNVTGAVNLERVYSSVSITHLGSLTSLACLVANVSSTSITAQDSYVNEPVCGYDHFLSSVTGTTYGVGENDLTNGTALTNWSTSVWNFVATEFPSLTWE